MLRKYEASTVMKCKVKFKKENIDRRQNFTKSEYKQNKLIETNGKKQEMRMEKLLIPLPVIYFRFRLQLLCYLYYSPPIGLFNRFLGPGWAGKSLQNSSHNGFRTREKKIISKQKTTATEDLFGKRS